MSQFTGAQKDPSGGTPDNGDARTSGHALMVREHESQALSPYMGMTPGGMYFDGTPAGLSISELAHALRRRWLLAAIVGALIAVPVAALVWLVTPDNYDVVAYLHVGDDAVKGTKTGGMRNQAEYDYYRKTQAQRIRSPLVLQNALRKLSEDDSVTMLRAEREPQRFLEDEVSVSAPLEQELLAIRMRGRDPRQLVKIVNAVRDSYMENIANSENQENYQRYSLYQKDLKAIEDDLATKTDRYVELQKKMNAADLPAVKYRYESLMQQTAQLRDASRRNKDELGKVEMRLEILKNQQEKGAVVPDYLVQLNLSRDDEIAYYTRMITQLEMAIDSEMTNSRKKEKDPSVKFLKTQIASLQARKDQRAAEMKPAIIKHLASEMLKDSNGQETTDPEQLEIKRQRLQADYDSDQKNLEGLEGEVEKLGKATGELENLDTEIKGLSRSRDKRADDLRDVRLALDMPARVTPLEKASVPDAPSQVFRLIMTIFAGMAGFVLGSGAIVAFEYNAHRISSGGELSSRTGLRVLGTVPNLEVLSRAKGLNGAAAMQGILAESVDSFRTILLQQTRADAPKVIMVTSAGDREGKTTVASHLAASLARSGRRTLLVDGDLRSPTIHAMFSAALEPGVCEMLRGEADLEAVIQPTQVDGLMLVAAGQCDYHAIAALSKAPLKDVLQKAREQFEFVIFDAAPILTYADTLLLGAHVDAAVLSVRRDVSQMHKVHEAKERMESVGIRVLGAVVNGITETGRRPAYALPAPV
jgi:polysaccharide biosynthesis transport protein